MTMMLKDRKLAFAGSRSFFPLIILALLACFSWYATRLQLIIVPEGDRLPVSFTVQPGSEWRIRLTHSVELTPWEDYFTVHGPRDMTMTHTTFESLGWGFPYAASDGKLSHTEDGRYLLVMNRPYQDINLRISEQAMQHILYQDLDYDLVAMYGQGTAVTVKARYRYQYWYETWSIFDFFK